MSANQEKKEIRVPHTFVIVFCVILFCSALTYFVPLGVFDVQKVTYKQGHVEKTRTVLVSGSFRYAVDEQGNQMKYRTPLFATEDFGGKTGVLNAVFEGIVSGDKWSSAVGVMAFILVVGGAFGIILRSGAIDRGLISLIANTKGFESLLIVALFIMFSLGGAVFGMAEEAIPFVLIVCPLMVALGYDSIVALMCVLGATQIGFGASWMNPFSLAVAQGVSGIPLMSGAKFRIVMWIVFTTLGIAYTLIYAKRIKKNPEISVSYKSDAFFREQSKNASTVESKITTGDTLVLLTLFATMVWVIWGVVQKGYYIPEIASQFFTMGLVSGIIAVIFKLNNMTLDDVAKSFQAGAADLLGAALLVGVAKGIILVLGGSDANTPSVLNTILQSTGNLIQNFPPALSAWFMYVFQSIFNFFVVSGSGQAALTMPLMAPLSDIVGVTRQVAVLAFQLGDGFTNLIVPTSGVLIACLGGARLDFWNWARFQIKFQLLLFTVGSAFVIFATLSGYN